MSKEQLDERFIDSVKDTAKNTAKKAGRGIMKRLTFEKTRKKVAYHFAKKKHLKKLERRADEYENASREKTELSKKHRSAAGHAMNAAKGNEKWQSRFGWIGLKYTNKLANQHGKNAKAWRQRGSEMGKKADDYAKASKADRDRVGRIGQRQAEIRGDRVINPKRARLKEMISGSLQPYLMESNLVSNPVKAVALTRKAVKLK